MVQAFILSEQKTKWRHSIKILVIMKHDSWIQEVNYWYDDKTLKQHTTLFNKDELKKIAKAMED